VILGVRAIATALACGNAVVFKASEICPRTHEIIVEAFAAAGLPEGLIGVVTNSPESAGDVVGALIKLMDRLDSVGQVYNIGSNEEISIFKLAEKVKELTNSDSEIVFVPYDEAYEEGFEDMPRRVPDIAKINELVGFRPEMTLEGILQSVISFHSGRPSSLDD